MEENTYKEFIEELDEWLLKAESLLVRYKGGSIDLGSINTEKPNIRFEQKIVPKLKCEDEYIEYKSKPKHKSKKELF